MAEESGWQPNYVDLSDDRMVRFGGACTVCDARYATAPEPLVAIPPVDREPDPATAQAIEEQKFRVFTEFDAAFRSITIRCFRCGDLACPECWDVDKQMCGRCVAERGLTRSPHRGGPVEGPLADGFLRRLEPGRYSEVSRPAWLKELLRTQSDSDAARAANLTAPPLPGSLPAASAPPVPRTPPARVSGAPRERSAPVAPSARSAPKADPPLPADPAPLPAPPADLVAPTAPPADPTFPQAPMLLHEPFLSEPPPTNKMEAGAAPPPALSFSLDDTLSRLEGAATSDVVECPRCRTPNYDFVTQCTECGLQLIQICPACEKLNPGHASKCQYCGAQLDRPQGWSGLRPAVPVAPKEARRRMTGRPMSPRPAAPPAAPSPAAWGSAADEDEDFASAPAAPPLRQPVRPVVLAPEREPAPMPLYPVAPAPAPVAQRHPYESAGPTFGAAAPVAALHPYEVAGPGLVPIMAQDPTSHTRLQASVVLAEVWTLVERVITIAVLLGLFVVVGAITGAEASPQANNAIHAAVHIDIKKTIDHLLLLLHLSGHN